MDTTDRHRLPLLMPSQAQKHVTHNAAIDRIDGLIGLSLSGLAANAPPADARPGEAFLVGEDPEGGFAGEAGHVAVLTAAGWIFLTPVAGLVAHVGGEQRFLVFDGAGWVALESQLKVERVERLGIASAADQHNRLTVRGPGALFAAEPAGEGGSGDVRIALNRASDAGTASILFQSEWTGRAEIGLTGAGGLAVNTSADGAAWAPALFIAPDGGLSSAGAIRPGAAAAASLPPPGMAGALIVVSDAEGGPVLAVSTATGWRRLVTAPL